MFPDPVIDMIGAQDVEEEEMQLSIGNGHVICTGGAEGTDELADEMAKHFGMQVAVIVPPNPRANYICPATVEVLVLANPHLHQAAQNCVNVFPVIFTRFNCCNAITSLLKRLIPSMPLAHWKRMPNESKGERGGPCNWFWIKAKKFTCLIFPVKLGTGLKFTTTSATILPVW